MLGYILGRAKRPLPPEVVQRHLQLRPFSTGGGKSKKARPVASNANPRKARERAHRPIKPPLLFTHAIPPRHPPPVLRVWNPGDPVPDRFAILSSKFNYRMQQHKVLEGDRIMCDLLKHRDSRPTTASFRAYDIDDEVTFNNVLLVGSRKHTLVGRPLIPGAFVKARVEEVTQLRKIIVSRKRKRMKWQKKQGHRHWVTILKIERINCNFGAYMDKEFVENQIRKEQEDREYAGVWAFMHGDDLKIVNLPENEGDEEVASEDLEVLEVGSRSLNPARSPARSAGPGGGATIGGWDGTARDGRRGGDLEPVAVHTEGWFETQQKSPLDAVGEASANEQSWERESRAYDVESGDEEDHEDELLEDDESDEEGADADDDDSGRLAVPDDDEKPVLPNMRRGRLDHLLNKRGGFSSQPVARSRFMNRVTEGFKKKAHVKRKPLRPKLPSLR